jgi:hypothetical protein
MLVVAFCTAPKLHIQEHFNHFKKKSIFFIFAMLLILNKIEFNGSKKTKIK